MPAIEPGVPGGFEKAMADSMPLEMDALLDDALLHSILERLDAVSLAASACTCRRWRRLCEPLWPELLAQLEPPGFLHGPSWLACGQRLPAYLGWRLSWWGFLDKPTQAGHSAGPCDPTTTSREGAPCGGGPEGASGSGADQLQQQEQQEQQEKQEKQLNDVPASRPGVDSQRRMTALCQRPGGVVRLATTPIIRRAYPQATELQVLTYDPASGGAAAAGPRAEAGLGPQWTSVTAMERLVGNAFGPPRGELDVQQPHQPTWSPGGRMLAAPVAGGGGTSCIGSPYLLVDDFRGRRLLQLALGRDSAYSTPFYMSWSPCGNYLALLAGWWHRGHDRGVGLRVLDVASALGPARAAPRMAFVGSGYPLFFHWCPTAPRLVVHASRKSHFLWDAARADFRPCEPDPLATPAPTRAGGSGAAAAAAGASAAGVRPWVGFEFVPHPRGDVRPQWRPFLALRRGVLAMAPEWVSDPRVGCGLLMVVPASSVRRLQVAAAALDARAATDAAPAVAAAGDVYGGPSGAGRFAAAGAAGASASMVPRSGGGSVGDDGTVVLRLALGAEQDHLGMLEELSSDPRFAQARPMAAVPEEGDEALDRRLGHRLLLLDPDSLGGTVGQARLLADVPQVYRAHPARNAAGGPGGRGDNPAGRGDHPDTDEEDEEDEEGPGHRQQGGMAELLTAVSPDGRLLAWATRGQLFCKDLAAGRGRDGRSRGPVMGQGWARGWAALAGGGREVVGGVEPKPAVGANEHAAAAAAPPASDPMPRDGLTQAGRAGKLEAEAEAEFQVVAAAAQAQAALAAPPAAGGGDAWQLWPPPAPLAGAFTPLPTERGDIVYWRPNEPSSVVGLQWAPGGGSPRLLVLVRYGPSRGHFQHEAIRPLVWEFAEASPQAPQAPDAASRPTGHSDGLRPVRLYEGVPYVPSNCFAQEYLPFLDQYLCGACPSLGLWAADGSAIVLDMLLDLVLEEPSEVRSLDSTGARIYFLDQSQRPQRPQPEAPAPPRPAPDPVPTSAGPSQSQGPPPREVVQVAGLGGCVEVVRLRRRVLLGQVGSAGFAPPGPRVWTGQQRLEDRA